MIPRWAQFAGTFGLGVVTTTVTVTLTFAGTASRAENAEKVNATQDVRIDAHDVRLRAVEQQGAAVLARLDSLDRGVARIEQMLRESRGR